MQRQPAAYAARLAKISLAIAVVPLYTRTMKKWLRRTLIAALVVGLTLAALYEAATHVGRGWLRGEAFYEGRPTSYWCCKIENWMEMFDSPDDAARGMKMIRFGVTDMSRLNPDLQRELMSQYIPGTFNSRINMTKHEGWPTKLSEGILGRAEAWDHPPRVLFGYEETESVLRELIRNEKVREIAVRGLKNHEITQKIASCGFKPRISVCGEKFVWLD